MRTVVQCSSIDFWQRNGTYGSLWTGWNLFYFPKRVAYKGATGLKWHSNMQPVDPHVLRLPFKKAGSNGHGVLIGKVASPMRTVIQCSTIDF